MKLILAALDGSPRAPEVLRIAVDLAQRLGARIVVCRAVGVPYEVPDEAYSLSPTKLMELLESEAQRYLVTATAGCPPELIADRIVHVGVAWQGVCSVAERTKADLIVVGSHGYSGLDRILGTTAAKIVNHAHVSVLVARGPLGAS